MHVLKWLAPALVAVGCGGSGGSFGFGPGSPDLGGHRGGHFFSVDMAGGGSHHTGGAVPSASTPVYVIQSGVSVATNPSAGPSYAISANSGNAYRLVWLDGASVGHFTGSVWTRGTFTSVTPGCGGVCLLQSEDFVSVALLLAGGQRVDFDSRTGSGASVGLDFTVDTEPVYFQLQLEDQAAHGISYFISGGTGQQSTAGATPFGLTPSTPL